MSQKQTELNKEAKQIQKKFNKGEINCEEYVKAYKTVKVSHSQA